MRRPRALPVLILALALGLPARAQDKPKGSSPFRDGTDGAFDMSEWLLTRKGFLFMPTIITEPSVGFGGAAGIVFFHSSISERQGPPSMTGVIGGGTVNGTWLAGVFHEGVWRGDTIRYRGALIRTKANIAYYGSGDYGILGDEPVNLNLDAWLLLQQAKFRIGRSPVFVGGRYLLLKTKNTFEIPVDIPEFTGTGFDSTLSELTALAEFDSRDNVFSPAKGVFLELTGTYSDTWFGGEGLYGRIGATAVGYLPAGDKVTVGIRYEGRFSLGPVPFYARPSVDLRGAPVSKFQNKNTTLMETEVDWNLYKRWSVLGFTGLGHAFSSFTAFDKGKTVRTLGAGFRYLIARKLGAQAGLDFAVSNSDFAFYVVFGSSWMK